MGLHIDGRNVAGLRFGGRNAVEAKLNGAIVWSAGLPRRAAPAAAPDEGREEAGQTDRNTQTGGDT